VKLSSKRNTSDATTTSSGNGDARRARRAKAYAQAGNASNPTTATSFSAMPYGTTRSTSTMSSAGTTM